MLRSKSYYFIKKLGVKIKEGLTKYEASKLIEENFVNIYIIKNKF